MKYLLGVVRAAKLCCLRKKDGKFRQPLGEYPSYYPNPGWVEYDINEIKNAVFACIREAVNDSGVNSTEYYRYKSFKSRENNGTS